MHTLQKICPHTVVTRLRPELSNCCAVSRHMGHWRVALVEGGGGGLEGLLEYLGLFLVDLLIGLQVENKRIEVSNVPSSLTSQTSSTPQRHS